MLKSKRAAVMALLMAAAILVSILVRVPAQDEKVYYSQDATYHVLLTAYAYDETPASVHKFLPLVTLGEPQDKFISWGANLSDEFGNQYYTSFSPAGFVAPYAFFKLFHMPFTLNSLYLFNSTLYVTCIVLVWYLFKTMFHDSSNCSQLGLLAAALYAFQTETLHSQGIIYWHQSLFQFFLLLQLICFIKEKRGWFLLFCVLNPYTEWTGYVANAGFALVYLLRKKWIPFFSVCAATAGALTLFVLHYAMVFPLPEVLTAMYKRFFSRSVASAVGWDAFIKGYIYSYAILFVLLFVLMVHVAIGRQRRHYVFFALKQHWAYALIMLFPLLENILMQQHVVFYTYDRLKATLPMIYLFLLLVNSIDLDSSITSASMKRRLKHLLVASVVGMACCNMAYYLQDTNFYAQKVEYLKTNNLLADYIKENYPLDDCVLAQNNSTRGYSNLLFHRGIYEHKKREDYEDLMNGQRYYIYLESADLPFNIYHYTSATVYDTVADTVTILTLQDNSIQATHQ